MSTTKIDWASESVNFFTGCRNGCSFCYARKFAKRLANMPGGWAYKRVKNATGDPFSPALHLDIYEREIERLNRVQKHKRVFVGSMGDMCFGGWARKFEEAADCILESRCTSKDVQDLACDFARAVDHTILLLTKRPDLLDHSIKWPRNVHLGVSVTDNEDVWRIEELKNRFEIPRRQITEAGEKYGRGSQAYMHVKGLLHPPLIWTSIEPLLDYDFDPECLEGLDWVVVGALTGRKQKADAGLREAANRIIDYCAAYNIPVFAKDNFDRLFPDRQWSKQLPERSKNADTDQDKRINWRNNIRS